MPPRVADMFYQAVVASILLHGSKTWVLPSLSLKAFEGFYVETARRLTEMFPLKIKGE